MEKIENQQEKTKQKIGQNVQIGTFSALTHQQGQHFSLQFEYSEGHGIKLQDQISQPYERLEMGECENKIQGISLINKKQSIYHNFQKHLVNTLKTHINLNNYRQSERTSDRLMFQLWQYFLRSNKTTKRYLYSLLMNIPQNIIEHKSQRIDKNYQQSFKNILKKASTEDIKTAQSHLRLNLIQQCKQLVSNGFLNNRRMHKIEEFKNYFNIFIQDLENGILNLRIGKQNTPHPTYHSQEKDRKAHTVLKQQNSQ